MRKLSLLVLITMMSSAFAADEFGGVTFDPSVDKNQSETLKNDLRYLYKTPVSDEDAEFLATAELATGDGPNMHNWLLNRVKYILGESFELAEKNIVTTAFTFPETPQADVPEKPAQDGSREDDTNTTAKTVMSNLGGALYLVGKQNSVAFGIKLGFFNKFYVKSPRAGLLQVGEGLFFKKFLLNEDVSAPANSISRLSTLFHEARHSDGNGKSTSFLHAYCPRGHVYSGVSACEVSGNGPYTIGALAQRHLLKNCDACSTTEKAALAAGVVDSFNRILDLSIARKISGVESEIASTEMIIDSYHNTILRYITFEPQRSEFLAELKKLEAKLVELKAALIVAQKSAPEKPAFMNASPEGEWTPISLKDSMKKMERSLR